MKKVFTVPVVYEMFADIEVVADSEDEAIAKALASTTSDCFNHEVVPDSIRFDGGAIECYEADEK